MPDFFGHPGGIADCARAVRSQDGRAAVADGRVIAFVTWAARTTATAELTWMAVERARRNQGIGTALVELLLDDLHRRGQALALVMTAAGADNDADPYAATRRFWRAGGFLPLTELDIWEANRALLLVHPLG